MSMNPIKQDRILMGLTQEGLAHRCGIHPNSLVKYELGLYQKISPKILSLTEPGPARQHLTKRYTEWQHLNRASNKWRFYLVTPSTLDLRSKPDVNPAVTLLEVTKCPSLYAMATWLCVHQDVLSKYARRRVNPRGVGPSSSGASGAGCRKMPPLIRNALNEVIPASTIDHIELLMRGYDE